jgi:hypothetical protein
MNKKELLGKIAVDKNDNKLGKIVNIEKLPGKTIKVDKPHAIILYKKLLKQKALIPIDVTKIKTVSDQKVIFQLTKEDFLQEVERYIQQKELREKHQDFVSVHSKWFQTDVSDRRPNPHRKK